MHVFTRVSIACVVLSGLLIAGPIMAQNASISVQVDRPGVKVSPMLYGIFFEEINRAGDGGIYAELVQNRGFEDAAVPVGWQLVKGGDAEASMTLDKSQPLNANNPTSLRLAIAKPGTRAGVANVGFRGTNYPKGGDVEKWFAKFEEAVKESKECVNGIAVESGKQYKLSLYVRCDAAFHGPLVASLEKADGTVLAQQTTRRHRRRLEEVPVHAHGFGHRAGRPAGAQHDLGRHALVRRRFALPGRHVQGPSRSARTWPKCSPR